MDPPGPAVPADMSALPKVNSRFGAPMGRGGVSPQSLASSYASSAPEGCRVSLSRIPLNRGGYDQGGAYWGSGEPVWRARFTDRDGEVRESFFRARGRKAAKALVPGVRFYR